MFSNINFLKLLIMFSCYYSIRKEMKFHPFVWLLYHSKHVSQPQVLTLRFDLHWQLKVKRALSMYILTNFSLFFRTFLLVFHSHQQNFRLNISQPMRNSRSLKKNQVFVFSTPVNSCLLRTGSSDLLIHSINCWQTLQGRATRT